MNDPYQHSHCHVYFFCFGHGQCSAVPHNGCIWLQGLVEARVLFGGRRLQVEAEAPHWRCCLARL